MSTNDCAETTNINRESTWYPILVVSSFIGAVAVITTVLLKLISAPSRFF